MSAHLKLTEDRQAMILRTLRLGFSLEDTSQIVGVSRSSVHRLRQRDPEFDEAVRAAQQQAEATITNLLAFGGRA